MKTRNLGSIALVLLGVGIAGNAVLGPLGVGVIKLHISASMENQLLGGEFGSLFVVAPVALLAAILWWRSHPTAPVLALGVALYSLYTYPQFVLGPEYARYSGNNEYFFPLYLTLVLLALGITIIAWGWLGKVNLPQPPRGLSNVFAAVLILVSVVFSFAWISSIAAVLGRTPLVGEYQQDQTLFWMIRLLDLGFVIPAAVLTAVGLMRRAPWSRRLAYAFVGMQTLLMTAVACMAATMSIRNDPGASSVLVETTILLAIVLAAICLRLLRLLARDKRPIVAKEQPDLSRPQARLQAAGL